MRVYTYILYILFILHSVSVSIAVKYSYGRPSYNDRSLRGYEDQEFEPGYSPRFKQYRPSYRYRPSRSGRQRHDIDYERERSYYNNPSRENDPSIEVIVDPGKKKAVAVIENGPAGQSRYELTGYQMAVSDSEAQATNQDQASNLDNPAVKLDRKRNPKIFDSNAEVDSENYENDKSKVDEPLMDSEKTKRSTNLKKRKINKASKIIKAPVKQEYRDEQVAGIPTKRKSENKAENCPPHLEEQSKDQKLRNEEGNSKENAEKNHAKREITNAFSESQLNALSDSLAKVKDTGADMENLKHVLYDMGLVRNYQTIDKRDAQSNDEQAGIEDKQQAKRDLEQTEAEDEDMNKDNIIMKRDSEAGYEQPWMDEDDANWDEEMDKRDAESDNWDETEDEQMADEPMDKRASVKYESEASELEEAKMSDENAKEMEGADVPLRDKRQNMEKQEENSEENQNEMIDNYEKELKHANLESTARDKREEDKNKRKENEKRSDKDEQKRSGKDEDKLIKDAENQKTSEITNADDKKKLTKRENDAVEKRQGNEETKKKMESEIKEKIQMIKEKVKREILEENAQGRQRNVRAADSLDLDGSFRRSKRDLSGASTKDEDDVNLNFHDLKHYILNRSVNTTGNVTQIQDLKSNQTILPETDAKALDPILDSQNLKTHIRQHRALNATNETKIMQAIPQNADKNAKQIVKETGKNSNDSSKELEPAVRKRRDIKDVQQKQLLEPEQKTILREKRANGVPEKQMVYEPFQNGDVDETEEEGEFGDNYKDGRLYIDKRQAGNEEEYLEGPQKQETDQQYESEVTYLNGETPEQRRLFVEDNAGAAMRSDNERDKRNNEEPLDGNANLTDEEEYSENLYFGPLSKTYNGELTRYKRVKRDKP